MIDPSDNGSSSLAESGTAVFPLDTTDRRILSILGKNARLSARAIAREMNVSAGQVIERMKRLEQSGVIRGYRVEVNHELAGFGIAAFASIQIEIGQEPEAVLAAAMAIPEIEVSHWTTGTAQLLLTIRVSDYAQLHRLMMGPLRQLPGSLAMSVSVGMAAKRRIGGQFAFTWQDNGECTDE
ncbi:Lrp/AsnC family transcriptional regulator [Bordetella sp. BOR01]|uniref:Lrp/AsnC family transcriptional regulator n=1 Tax=Bordetella sp. BOR01 TaxID=2854779 RepID=UPI001C468D94|nr:Lrp/AsnC family transcriptional regulator [Bordetella sp. BOR01]MBV7482358.1 Lrp/AsnC family transcriptional regulator [Bordetella sp. BOR01]